MVIDSKLLDDLSAQAKASPWLRMNLNFHQSRSVIFESKEGPFVPHEEEGILTVKVNG